MTGTRGHLESTVTETDTAVAVGSGDVRVLATPAMIALMEKAAAMSIQAMLQEGQSSVGTRISVTHCSATPVGMKVTVETEAVSAEGRTVVFSVKAYDQAGLIGEGTHERVIIDRDRFQRKAEGKSGI